MSRVSTFTFRVSARERELITALATRLARTESDAVRWLIQEAARELKVISPVEHPKEMCDALALASARQQFVWE